MACRGRGRRIEARLTVTLDTWQLPLISPHRPEEKLWAGPPGEGGANQWDDRSALSPSRGSACSGGKTRAPRSSSPERREAYTPTEQRRSASEWTSLLCKSNFLQLRQSVSCICIECIWIKCIQWNERHQTLRDFQIQFTAPLAWQVSWVHTRNIWKVGQATKWMVQLQF